MAYEKHITFNILKLLRLYYWEITCLKAGPGQAARACVPKVGEKEFGKLDKLARHCWHCPLFLQQHLPPGLFSTFFTLSSCQTLFVTLLAWKKPGIILYLQRTSPKKFKPLHISCKILWCQPTLRGKNMATLVMTYLSWAWPLILISQQAKTNKFF